MTSFDQIQELWKLQQYHKKGTPDEIIRRAKQHTREIRRKHKGIIVILTLTVLMLLLYFISFSSRFANQALAGFMLMVLSILVRIAAESISYHRFAAIDIKKSLQQYAQETILFYQFRKKILFLLTPLVFALYVTGFLLLLSAAKKNISHSFYIYTIVSAILFALFISWLIIKQTKKEIKLLQLLTRLQEELKSNK
jgi:hypothetical protein